MSKKNLSEKEILFLEAIFGEAKGDPLLAKRMAGYSENTKTSEVIRALQDELVEHARLILAQNSPRAAIELVSLMLDPNQTAATTKLKAVESLLNRTGVSEKTKSEDINLKVPQGGLFIMPAKGSALVTEEKEEENGL